MLQVFLYLFSLLELIWNCTLFLNSNIGKKGHEQPWFFHSISSGLHSRGGCEQQRVWTFTHTCGTFPHVPAGTLFPDCWKASPVVLVIKNIAYRSAAENYLIISCLFIANKISEKLVNLRLADHLKKLFIWFLAWLFRSSLLTADLLRIINS